MNHSIFIIGYVWPEPTATAAGTRMLQLIQCFIDLGFKVVFGSPAQKSAQSFDLLRLGVQTLEVELNTDDFDDLIKKINPQIVMFDRFMMEEQFGWRVNNCVPNAIRILDSEDLHFLRSERLLAVQQGKQQPNGKIYSDQACREIASVYRCDLTLTISEFEMKYLQEVYQIPNKLLLYVPFLLSTINTIYHERSKREGFVFIGNMLHAPNRDAVLQLKKIWPLIKAKMPTAIINIYGGYMTQQILQLQNIKEGFLVKGRAEEVDEVMSKALLCLAPMRFGAGLKGKLIDAMNNGTPFVTTPIGAEGMFGDFSMNDCIGISDEDFVKKIEDLVTSETLWLTYQQKGREILEKRFLKQRFMKDFQSRIFELLNDIETHRKSNFIGLILQHHTQKSTQYLSKWIMEKNKNL